MTVVAVFGAPFRNGSVPNGFQEAHNQMEEMKMRRYRGERTKCPPWQMTGSAPSFWRRFIESAGSELKAIQCTNKAEVRKREAAERRQSIAIRWKENKEKEEEKQGFLSGQEGEKTRQ